MGVICDTTRLFSGKTLKERAKMWLKLHRRMGDYIQQAPILVAAEDDPDTRLALYRLCERGAKLREVMEACGFNVGLRHVHPHALNFEERPQGFPRANPSAIAQQIAKRNIALQTQYLNQMALYARCKSDYGMQRDCGVSVEWVAENLPPGEHDMRHYSDIPAEALMEHGFRSNMRWRDFKAILKKWEDSYTEVVGQRVFWNEQVQRVEWTNVETRDLYAPAAGINIAHEYQQQLIREIERRCCMGLDTAVLGSDRSATMIYHGGRQMGKTLTVEAMRKLMEDRTKALTPHKSAVLEDSSGPYTFRMLNTENELTDEGAAMRHCVGGYGSKVRGGHSLIYSISKDGKRIATMELASAGYDGTKQDRAPEHRGWRFEQIKGVRNAPVGDAIETIARAFAGKHFKIIQGSEWETYRWTPPRIRPGMVLRNPILNYNVDA